MMDKFWEDILLGIENTTEAEWDKLFSDFEKDGYINDSGLIELDFDNSQGLISCEFNSSYSEYDNNIVLAA